MHVAFVSALVLLVALVPTLVHAQDAAPSDAEQAAPAATDPGPMAPLEAAPADDPGAASQVPSSAAPASAPESSLRYPVAPTYPTAPPLPEELLPARTATLLRVLDRDLSTLADQGEGRVLSGTVGILIGVAFVSIAPFVDSELVRSLLYVGGGFTIARAITELAIMPDASGPARTFRMMPLTGFAEARARLAYGENALFKLAKRSRAARITDGTLGMTSAAIYVPLYWYFRDKNEPGYSFGDDGVDYLTVVVSVLGFTSGLVTAVRKTGAERRAKAYRELKEGFVRDSPAEFARAPTLRLTGARHGLHAAAAWQW